MAERTDLRLRNPWDLASAHHQLGSKQPLDTFESKGQKIVNEIMSYVIVRLAPSFSNSVGYSHLKIQVQ